MEKKIKLIWDFHGPDAHGIAAHHRIHLEEFAVREKLSINETGIENPSAMHTIAFMIVEEKDMIPVRDALKPHRAQLAE